MFDVCSWEEAFLVVLFSFKVKMPDSYSDVFFLPTTDLTRKGPLFTETSETTKAKSGQRKLSAMGPSSFFFYFFNVTYKARRD